MQYRRAKFQNKLNQVQLYSLINVIDIIEKVAEYDHPIECCPKQLQLLVIQWMAHQKCMKGINRVKQMFYVWLLNK